MLFIYFVLYILGTILIGSVAQYYMDKYNNRKYWEDYNKKYKK